MKCTGCDSPIVGKYVQQEGKPFCEKCFQTKLANNCTRCGKIIGVEARDIIFDEKHYHADCFACAECGASMADKPIVRRGEQLCCADCKQDAKPSDCGSCNKRLKPGDKITNFKGQQFHAECFTCADCRTPLSGSFMPKGDGYVCNSCYKDKYSSNCARCGEKVTGSTLTFKDDKYHEACFTCGVCSKRLGGEPIATHEERPYCQACFTNNFCKSCDGCGQPAAGFDGEKVMSFGEKNWHGACFNCTVCRASLVGEKFAMKNGNIACSKCA